MSSKRWKWAVVIMAVLLGVSGCGGVTGINQTGVVLALGIDPGIHGQYQWTFMFPNPSITPSSESSIQPNQEFYLLSTQANTLAQAVEKVSATTDRHVYLGDTQVVALNDTFSSAAMRRLVQVLITTGNLPPRVWLTLAEPSAVKTLRTSSPEEVVPTLFLSSYFSCDICHALHLATRLWQVWDDMLVPSQTAVIPVTTVMHKTIEVNRCAWLTPSRVIVCSPAQTVHWAMVMGLYKNGALQVLDNKRSAYAEDVRISTRRRVDIRGRRAVAYWKISVAGHWQSVQRNAANRALNLAAEREILHNVLALYRWAGQEQADPFGVRNQLVWLSAPHSSMPPLEVSVQCHITSTARTV